MIYSSGKCLDIQRIHLKYHHPNTNTLPLLSLEILSPTTIFQFLVVVIRLVYENILSAFILFTYSKLIPLLVHYNYHSSSCYREGFTRSHCTYNNLSITAIGSTLSQNHGVFPVFVLTNFNFNVPSAISRS